MAGVLSHYLVVKSELVLITYCIYAEVVAGVSIMLALLWLMPFSGRLAHYAAALTSLVLCMAWIVSFVFFVLHIASHPCDRVLRNMNVSARTDCQKWMVARAFSFLSAAFWLISAIAVRPTNCIPRLFAKPGKGFWAIIDNRRHRRRVNRVQAR